MARLLSLSERRRRIARINGAKSRGPVTAAGKARSSRNAVKHGFRSNLILPEELPADFAETSGRLLEDLDPASPAESALAHQMALASHRIERLRCLEATAFREELARLPHLSGPTALAEAFRNLVERGTLPLIYRYEVTNGNRWYRALAKLIDLRRAKAGQALKNRQVPNEPGTALTPITSKASRQFQPFRPKFGSPGNLRHEMPTRVTRAPQGYCGLETRRDI
jgi:hypothetical protein